MGNLFAVIVHAANIYDTKSCIRPAKQAVEKYPTIKKFCGNEEYRKSFEEAVTTEPGVGVGYIRTDKAGMGGYTQKVIVERTLSWLGHSRRLSKD